MDAVKKCAWCSEEGVCRLGKDYKGECDWKTLEKTKTALSERLKKEEAEISKLCKEVKDIDKNSSANDTSKKKYEEMAKRVNIISDKLKGMDVMRRVLMSEFSTGYKATTNADILSALIAVKKMERKFKKGE